MKILLTQVYFKIYSAKGWNKKKKLSIKIKDSVYRVK